MSERTGWVEWVEQFNQSSDPVYCRVSVEVAIKTQKMIATLAHTPYKYEDDDRALEDFMTVHWAEFVYPTEPL